MTVKEAVEFLRSGCGGCEEPDDVEMCEVRMDDIADLIEMLQMELEQWKEAWRVCYQLRKEEMGNEQKVDD